MGATKPEPDSKKRQDRPPPYLNTNRNKRSITMNLKNGAGRDLATWLATKADVVVENFSAEVMRRLRLDYDSLRPVNPGLIYVSMSGYGHNGPRKDWTSMNMNLQAYTGLMMVTGAEGDLPTAISNSWNDYIGGLHACFGILQALTERATTGVGANLDLSQFECSVATFGALLMSSAANNTAPPRLGGRSSRAAPQGVYRCAGADEWCAVSVQTDEQWRALVQIMDNPPWAMDQKLETLVGRLRYHDELDQGLEAWTGKLAHTEVERRLKAGGIPAERMRRMNDLIDSADGATVFRPMEDPVEGARLVTGVPFAFSGATLAPLKPAPALGRHTAEVLREWLDLDDGEIKKLGEQGALE
jgi:crotonobetainyl-CoA:carnitine CoA-transferase CaiB-like acyl-CoA transferase